MSASEIAELCNALPPDKREAARRSYRLFGENPAHPSLRFKKLAGHDSMWSVRINDSFRALAERNGEREGVDIGRDATVLEQIGHTACDNFGLPDPAQAMSWRLPSG